MEDTVVLENKKIQNRYSSIYNMDFDIINCKFRDFAKPGNDIGLYRKQNGYDS